MALIFPPLNRRNLLKLGGATALLNLKLKAAAASGLMPTTEPGSATRLASATQLKSLWIFDPQLEHSQIPAGTTQAINVNDERESEWRWLRFARPVDHAAGVTRWSDFLIIRGHLEGNGMRLLELTANDTAFHWVFLRRQR